MELYEEVALRVEQFRNKMNDAAQDVFDELGVDSYADRYLTTFWLLINVLQFYYEECFRDLDTSNIEEARDVMYDGIKLINMALYEKVNAVLANKCTLLDKWRTKAIVGLDSDAAVCAFRDENFPNRALTEAEFAKLLAAAPSPLDKCFAYTSGSIDFPVKM